MPAFMKNIKLGHMAQVVCVALITYSKSNPSPLMSSLSEMAFGALGVLGLVTGSVAPSTEAPAAPKAA